MAITFMAKYDEREGNSCHIHLSLRRDGDAPLFAHDDGAVRRASSPASSPACAS